MSDIFRKVKKIFTNLKGLITTNEKKDLRPYDMLVKRFSMDKPLDVSELDGIKELCKKITSEEGQEIVDKRFGILKDLMFEKIIETSSRSQVVVNDKKIKNKADYKEFIKKEYKRMIGEDPEVKKEVKRVKKNIKTYENDVSWGILPEKWKLVRENAPIDVVEFALNNDDESKGPVLFMGDVGEEEEIDYFTEEYLKELYSRSKPQDILCDLYNPETNCRKCIRYEYNQEKLKHVKEEEDRERCKGDELIENIKDKFGAEMEVSDKIIKKTTNLEDKVWLSFLFNKDFKFSELSDREKNVFFSKLKKSGVLCMDALENGSENDVNKKSREFATKKELFDIKENNVFLAEGSILNDNENGDILKIENEQLSLSSSYKPEDNVEEEEAKREESRKEEAKREESRKEEAKRESPFDVPLVREEKMPEGTSETTEDDNKKTPLFNFPAFKQEDSKVTTEDSQINLGNSNKSLFQSVKLDIDNKPKEGVKAFTPNLEPFKTEASNGGTPIPLISNFPINLPPPNFKESINKLETQTIGTEVKIPDDWHYLPKYPLETNKDSSINPSTDIKTHPPVFNIKSTQSKAEVPFGNTSSFNFEVKKDKPISPLTSFLPQNNLNTPMAPFAFTPSNPSLQTSAFPQTTSPSGPSKRKIGSQLTANTPNFPIPQFTSPFGTGQQSILQAPTLNTNPEFNKLVDTKQNNVPFLGEVSNPFETSNPLQYSKNDNLNFVDNTFKYNDIFNKSNQNLFLNSKSMFDDLIFDNNKKEDQVSNVRYLSKKDENNESNIFKSNIFGNDNDPWNK